MAVVFFVVLGFFLSERSGEFTLFLRGSSLRCEACPLDILVLLSFGSPSVSLLSCFLSGCCVFWFSFLFSLLLFCPLSLARRCVRLSFLILQRKIDTFLFDEKKGLIYKETIVLFWRETGTRNSSQLGLKAKSQTR